MELAQAHRKARTAAKRREEEIERDELEGGEINLIPYLDIVTNLMLFLLASIASGLILGHVNTQLPDGSRQPNPGQAKKKPNEQDLQLLITVTHDRLQIQSLKGGLYGDTSRPWRAYYPLDHESYPEPANRIPPPIDKNNKTAIEAWVKRCAPLTGSEQLCIDAVKAERGKLKLRSIPLFAYRKINQDLYSIAKKKWKGNLRPRISYKIVLLANADIPYGTIISLMDTLRCKLPEIGLSGDACNIPKFASGKKGKAVTAARLPADKEGKPRGGKGQNCLKDQTGRLICGEGYACTSVEEGTGYKHTCELYDPDKHALFPDIRFGTAIN